MGQKPGVSTAIGVFGAQELTNHCPEQVAELPPDVDGHIKNFAGERKPHQLGLVVWLAVDSEDRRSNSLARAGVLSLLERSALPLR